MEWLQFQEILEELFPVGEVLAKPQSRPVRQNPNWLQFVWTDSYFCGLERQDACHETEIKSFLWTKKKVPESNFLHHYWPPSGCFYFLRIHSNWRWQKFLPLPSLSEKKRHFIVVGVARLVVIETSFDDDVFWRDWGIGNFFWQKSRVTFFLQVIAVLGTKVLFRSVSK